jgi:hypothetical protein
VDDEEDPDICNMVLADSIGGAVTIGGEMAQGQSGVDPLELEEAVVIL